MNDLMKREKRPYISALFDCNKDFLYGQCGLELSTAFALCLEYEHIHHI